MLIGTYSGRGGSYFSPTTRQIVTVERDEIKHRFLRGEIDILVCTDAAAEGLNLQTADLLADGMHVARGTLTVDSFLNHLEKEIQKP